jgi:hypothetical protein
MITITGGHGDFRQVFELPRTIGTLSRVEQIGGSAVADSALADLLLVDGNPIADIKLVADPAKNFVVIMKDGKIYKNTLSH